MNSSQCGLYIHIPFCKSKCYYCDFYSIVNAQDLIDKYLISLSKEIVFILKNNNLEFPKITTLYLGGGTPSLLNKKQIFVLLYIIKEYFDFTTLQEVSVEMNPESVKEDELKFLKNTVLNFCSNLRLSLGVQSFNDKILNELGRIHNIRHIFYAVELFNKLNIINYNFDLIFGSPQQSVKDIEYDLNVAIKLNPAHISYYALTIEENTFFYKENYYPNADLQAEMYNLIVEFLRENKYIQYEISNFAKKKFECLHNMNYWLYKEYFGFGPSSVSFFNNKRIKNVSKIEEYLKNKFLYEIEEIDDKTKLKEQIMLGLRTTLGLPLESEPVKKYFNIIEKLLDEKKLVLDGDFVKISPEYRFLSNSIILEFM